MLQNQNWRLKPWLKEHLFRLLKLCYFRRYSNLSCYAVSHHGYVNRERNFHYKIIIDIEDYLVISVFNIVCLLILYSWHIWLCNFWDTMMTNLAMIHSSVFSIINMLCHYERHFAKQPVVSVLVRGSHFGWSAKGTLSSVCPKGFHQHFCLTCLVFTSVHSQWVCLIVQPAFLCTIALI